MSTESDSLEYKQKNDLPDLYNILGLTIDVCQDPKCDELIEKAYKKKAKLCHPDKFPPEKYSAEKRKEILEIFILLIDTYDILKEEKKRLAYNHKLVLNKQSSSDFLKLKKSATDYAGTIGEYKPPSDGQKISFKEQMRVLDAKHGFDSAVADPISQQDAKKKLNELTKSRTEQDINLKPEKLFDDGRFSLKKFNEAFDKTHNRNDNAMIQHNGVPSAWNDFGATTNYSNFDNLDNLYVDDNNRFDTGRQIYGSADFATPTRKITKEEVQNLNGADYVDSHNVLDDDYYRSMKTKLRERDSQADQFKGMKYGDFKRDDTAGYGIFDQLGYKIDDRLTFDIDEDDISKKYERLMAERQKDLLPGTGTPNKATTMPQQPRKQANRIPKGGR